MNRQKDLLPFMDALRGYLHNHGIAATVSYETDKKTLDHKLRIEMAGALHLLIITRERFDDAEVEDILSSLERVRFAERLMESENNLRFTLSNYGITDST